MQIRHHTDAVACQPVMHTSAFSVMPLSIVDSTFSVWSLFRFQSSGLFPNNFASKLLFTCRTYSAVMQPNLSNILGKLKSCQRLIEVIATIAEFFVFRLSSKMLCYLYRYAITVGSVGEFEGISARIQYGYLFKVSPVNCSQHAALAWRDYL